MWAYGMVRFYEGPIEADFTAPLRRGDANVSVSRERIMYTIYTVELRKVNL